MASNVLFYVTVNRIQRIWNVNIRIISKVSLRKYEKVEPGACLQTKYEVEASRFYDINLF